MISSNIGEVFCIFFTAALGMPEGLIPVQLLWVNLVTDGPPATALGFNPPDHGVMRRKPRDPTEDLITPWVFFRHVSDLVCCWQVDALGCVHHMHDLKLPAGSNFAGYLGTRLKVLKRSTQDAMAGRYLLVGAYVGTATVGIFAVWYCCETFFGIPVTADGHTPISFSQLRNWESCPAWDPSDFKPALSYSTAGGGAVTFDTPCAYFTEGKVKACTLSLTVLVFIEMFNALNALSEDGSLVQMPPWCNPWLLCAMALSFGLHFLILYVPILASVFSIVPLTTNEWLLVLLFASPVVLIDDVLKFVGRNFVNPPRQEVADVASVKQKET